jgi:hypothetical protein
MEGVIAFQLFLSLLSLERNQQNILKPRCPSGAFLKCRDPNIDQNHKMSTHFESYGNCSEALVLSEKHLFQHQAMQKTRSSAARYVYCPADGTFASYSVTGLQTHIPTTKREWHTIQYVLQVRPFFRLIFTEKENKQVPN